MGEFRNPFTDAKIVGVNVDPDEYHSETVKRGDPALPMTKTNLWQIGLNPIRWLNGYESPETDAKDDGALVDALFLTPDKFENRFAVYPATYPDTKTGDPKPWNNNANFCKEWKAEQGANVFVHHDDLNGARIAVGKLWADQQVKAIMAGAAVQVHVAGIYHDSTYEIDIPVKVLADIVPAVDGPFGKYIIDFKRTRSVKPDGWPTQVFNLGMHVQAALTLDLYTAATGDDRVCFRHIAQENYPPFHIEHQLLDSSWLELGRAFYLEALNLYACGLRRGQWAGYASRSRIDGANWVQPRDWMMLANVREWSSDAKEFHSETPT